MPWIRYRAGSAQPQPKCALTLWFRRALMCCCNSFWNSRVTEHLTFNDLLRPEARRVYCYAKTDTSEDFESRRLIRISIV
jgi:hypothetical protein